MERNLIMLGTGNAMVTKCYNTCFAVQNGEESVSYTHLTLPTIRLV